jgi:hypothetical protein
MGRVSFCVGVSVEWPGEFVRVLDGHSITLSATETSKERARNIMDGLYLL